MGAEERREANREDGFCYCLDPKVNFATYQDEVDRQGHPRCEICGELVRL